MLVQDFTGGLWIMPDPAGTTVQPGFAVPENALRVATNCEYLPSGGIRGRRGIVLQNSLTVDPALIGLWRHYPRSGQAAGYPRALADAANAGSFGTPWVIEGDLEIVNGTGPNVTLATRADLSDNLYLTAYPFFPPVGAVITGCSVRFVRRATAPLGDFRVQLMTLGNTWVGKSLARTSPTTPWDSSGEWEYVEYGGPGELWGITNNATWWDIRGVVVRVRALAANATAEIDYASIAFYWESDEVQAKTIAVFSDAAQTYYGDFTAGPPASLAVYGATPTLRVGQPPVFVTWPEKGKTFIFDGVNPVQYFNGTSYFEQNISADSLPMPRGPVATLWRNRLFAMSPGESDYSVYASDILDEAYWPADAHLSVNDPKGGTITGLEGYGDRLVIFKETGVWAFTGDIQWGGQLSKISGTGCIARRTVQVTEWGIVYLGRDGLYLTDASGAPPIELSLPIRALFAGRLDTTIYSEAVGHWHRAKQQYFLKLTPTSDTYVLQRIGDRWAWAHFTGMQLVSAVSYDGGLDNGELYSADARYVYRVDDGLVDVGVLGESPISVWIETRSLPFSAERRLGRVYYVRPQYRGAKALSGYIRYDDALSPQVTFTVGDTLDAIAHQHPRTGVWNLSHFGRFVGLSLANIGDGPNFELHLIDLDVLLRGKRRWPETT